MKYKLIHFSKYFQKLVDLDQIFYPLLVLFPHYTYPNYSKKKL